MHGTALRIVPLADEAELHRVTEECIARPPEVVIATTGIGFRGWVESAEGWGLGSTLLKALAPARLLARGPKARGAILAAGLADAWSPTSESSAELLEYLLTQPLTGTKIAVQLHGERMPGFVAALRGAAADVIEVPVYQWAAPADPAPVAALVDSICAHEVDAVTFTSAAAVTNLLATAAERGQREEVIYAFREPVVAACVGPIAAGPLTALGIPVVVPARSRLGALVRQLAHWLPARAPVLALAGHAVQLRGHAAVVDGAVKRLSPNAFALMRTLMRQPGRVISRRELADSLPYGATSDDHAVEQAIARLRAALGASGIVQTVIKRGYRLPIEPLPDDAPFNTDQVDARC